jgi:vitamin B12 transporter
MFELLFLYSAAPVPASEETLVVTASREALGAKEAPVSATVLDRDDIEASALPMTPDLLRLVPGVSVASTGPRGTQTQVRIRGAEANHSLLFVDGIRFNDPAAGNEARFELLTSDALSRIEVVRGPQSALWGSEAVGGVIAVDTTDPLKQGGLSGLGEYGSLDSVRASAHFGVGGRGLGLSGSAGWIRSDEVDSQGPSGERDGFDNRTASLKALAAPLPSLEVGLVGHWTAGRSEYDGFDPVTFAPTEDVETENRIGAIRGWLRATRGAWMFSADASYLDSANRNFLAGGPVNRTLGERATVGGQATRTFGGHSLTAAVEHEAEEFHARDQSYGGGTDQDRSRSLTAFVGQWRAEWSGRFSTDIAVRRDSFSAYADVTTLRAAALFSPAAGWRLHAGYGEGVAQPTFYDLYGFFPGNFLGNPDLKPETSKSWEAGVRWSGVRFSAGATAFTGRLSNEIVDTFDPVTFIAGTANVTGKSRRRGIELDAGYRPSDGVRFGVNYTWLDARERQTAGGFGIREVRRPRHSANLFAAGESGKMSWGVTAAYVGERSDRDFSAFKTVTLDDYLLASLNLGYHLSRNVEAFIRAENALDADYQDVFGYNTPGRRVHAGLRLRLGD